MQRQIWHWPCLPAQQTPIAVHILIKAVSQIRCLHAQQLQEHSHLHVYQHNYPETYTAGGEVARCWEPSALFWFFSGKTSNLSQGNGHFSSLMCCLALFFDSCALQFDDSTCSPLHMLNNGRREHKEMSNRDIRHDTSKPMQRRSNISSRNIYCN